MAAKKKATHPRAIRFIAGENLHSGMLMEINSRGLAVSWLGVKPIAGVANNECKKGGTVIVLLPFEKP